MLGKDIFITCHGYQKNLAKLLTKGERISNIPFHVTIAKHVNFFFLVQKMSSHDILHSLTRSVGRHLMQAHVQHLSSFNHQVIRTVFCAKYQLICVWLNFSNTVKYTTLHDMTPCVHHETTYDLHISFLRVPKLLNVTAQLRPIHT